MSSIKEKMKAVASAIAAIEKQFGKGAIMPLSGGEIAEIGASTWRWASAACRAAASSRSTAPNRRARRR